MKIANEKICGCGRDLEYNYQFVDYWNDGNDVFCNTLNEAKSVMKQRIKEEPELRCSIYEHGFCTICGEVFEGDGILFNENCPEYK